MTNHPSCVGWEQLQSLFSIVFCIDQNFQIIDANDTLKKHVDGLGLKPVITDVFDISRPSHITSFAAARDQTDCIFLMIAKDRRFAIRGQVVETEIDNMPALCFFGAPWLFWVNSNCPDVRLGLNDFSPQDVQLDQLFFMSTEKAMVSDLERLNTELTEAREELEQSHALRNAFFTQMSHEMRTPLNGVVSALTLLQDQMLPTDASQLVTLARSSARNMMQVTNYVLDLAKIDAAHGVADIEPFDMKELLASVNSIVAAKASEKQLELTWSVASDMPAHFLGDLTRLRQSLLNLLINAIKFTDTGSVTLTVSSLADDNSTSEIVRFAVIDTGIGIPQELQEQVFEPFWSGDTGKDPSERGTGLGLNIVRKNVELMEGHIHVESTTGQGTTFTIDLPLPAHIPETAANHQASMPADANAKFAGHILLVDDNETNLMLGAMILESMDVTVSKASGGLVAVKLAQELKPDLVLMDISMPDIDGFEATRRIREFASNEELPIVALTAYESDSERKRSGEVGMNGYLTKPIDRQKLAEKLAHWLPAAGAHDNQVADNLPEKSDLVDQSVIEDLQRQIGNKNVVIVIDKFLGEAAQRWEQLEDAIAAIKSQDCARHAHTLASTCKSFGLAEAGRQLASIEQTILSDGLPSKESIEQTRLTLRNSIARLRSVVASLS